MFFFTEKVNESLGFVEILRFLPSGPKVLFGFNFRGFFRFCSVMGAMYRLTVATRSAVRCVAYPWWGNIAPLVTALSAGFADRAGQALDHRVDVLALDNQGRR